MNDFEKLGVLLNFRIAIFWFDVTRFLKTCPSYVWVEWEEDWGREGNITEACC